MPSWTRLRCLFENCVRKCEEMDCPFFHYRQKCHRFWPVFHVLDILYEWADWISRGNSGILQGNSAGAALSVFRCHPQNLQTANPSKSFEKEFKSQLKKPSIDYLERTGTIDLARGVRWRVHALHQQCYEDLRGKGEKVSGHFGNLK